MTRIMQTDAALPLEASAGLMWPAELQAVKARLGRLFARKDARHQAALYLDGLLGTVERKNDWQLAEYIGDNRPWRIQAVLGRTQWDEAAARDLVRDYVIEHLGDEDGVLVLDDPSTGSG